MYFFWSPGVSSLCTIAVIAVERYIVVCYPMGAVLFQTRYSTVHKHLTLQHHTEHNQYFGCSTSNVTNISADLRHAVAGVVLSWVWSFVWNTPPLFGWGSYKLEGVKISCAPNWSSRDVGNMSYIIIYFVFCFSVPFSIIMVSYSRLLWTLRQVSSVNVGHCLVMKI